MIGGACLKLWSSTQAVLALSSGEAEYYAALKGAATALGFKSMVKDLGEDVCIRLFSDSAAAVGIIGRRGLGKVRHLDTGYLWLQDAVAKKKLFIAKVKGVDNPADLGTKFLKSDDIDKHLTFLNYSAEEGRSRIVPSI